MRRIEQKSKAASYTAVFFKVVIIPAILFSVGMSVYYIVMTLINMLH